MFRQILIFSFALFFGSTFAQLPVARDTITVIENGYILKMPWANGINFSNVSNIDLDFDGKKDLVLFDRLNQFGSGRFRCFINAGNTGQTKYKADTWRSYYFPPCANWAVLLDYNCDGKEDLFCSTSAGIKVYKNVSTPANVLDFTLVKSLLYSNYNPGGTPAIYNLYASSVGVPGISDIDNDGDLDILTFSPQGVFVEYHRNKSMELYGHCDSLVFEKMDDCWGKISESNCEVSFNQCPVKRFEGPPVLVDGKEYHAGSCLTCIDSDGDGDKDLVMGDISCNTVQYVHNTGTGTVTIFSDTTKRYPNFPNLNNTSQIKMNKFPCAYYVDVDGDNKKDLVATPNASGSDNCNSVWFYKNTSTTNTVNFQFVKNNLLQEEMIEVGQNSYPMVFDYNGDGKKDLLIGTYGYNISGVLSAKLTLYENTGSSIKPKYTLISRDYASLSQQSLNNVVPTSGDIDGDGDIDILIGTTTGKIHWLENTGGIGNPCNFSVFKNSPFGFTTGSSDAAPQLFDLDEDGKLDLLIGTKNGRIAYYQNIGTVSAPAFTLVTDFLGGVDVKGNANLYGLDGYAAPYFYKDFSGIKLLVGSVAGNIFHYSVSSITGTFNLITNLVNNYNEGGQSTICYEDVNADGKRDLFIGNASGGLSFFSSASPFVSVNEVDPVSLNSQIGLFPNPTSGELTLQVDKFEIEKGMLKIRDVVGKEVRSIAIHSNIETIDLSGLNKGIYFAEITLVSNLRTFSISKKIIKE